MGALRVAKFPSPQDTQPCLNHLLLIPANTSSRVNSFLPCDGAGLVSALNHQPSQEDRIDPSHLLKAWFFTRLLGELLPAFDSPNAGLPNADKVNPTPENHRFGLDVRVGESGHIRTTSPC
jgi:hypothetical protein